MAAFGLVMLLAAGLAATLAYGLPGLWMHLLLISFFAWLTGWTGFSQDGLLQILFWGAGAGLLSHLAQAYVDWRWGQRGPILNIFLLAGFLVYLTLGTALRPWAGLLGGSATAGMPLLLLGKRMGFGKLPLFYAGALIRISAALLTAVLAWRAAF